MLAVLRSRRRLPGGSRRLGYRKRGRGHTEGRRRPGEGAAIDTEAARRIWVGARGWRHRRWRGRFYPADLPAQWRLQYYCNEYPALWLRVAELRRLGGEERATFAELDPARYRLVLELPAEVPAPRGWQALRARLGPAAAALCALVAHPGAEAAARRGWTRLEAAPTLWGWRQPGRPALAVLASAAAAPPGVLLLTDGAVELRSQRAQLQQVLAGGSDEAWLFLDGAPPPIDRLEALRHLAELLGG